jgi:DNA mismatch endonuclease (patch repair protein)
MQTQKRRETRPELRLRRELWSRGLRYRVDAPLPLRASRRRADILFPRVRVAVFVDGCYWHACPLHGTSPRANASWWAEKLAANVRRDRDTDEQLYAIGWHSVRVWEHEDPAEAAARIEALVRREPSS